MANDFSSNPIVLDTFTAAINMDAHMYPGGIGFRIKSIEWVRPTTVGHTADIYTDTGLSKPLFNQTCVTALQGIEKKDIGLVPNVCIAISGVQSGSIKIFLA